MPSVQASPIFICKEAERSERSLSYELEIVSGSVMAGAFDDNSVKRILSAGREEQVLYIIPVGPY